MRPSSSSRSISGSTNLPKFTGEPDFHQLYCWSGSPPGWLRQPIASKSPEMAESIWVDWSTVMISTLMPTASACSLRSWAWSMVTWALVVVYVNDRSWPVSASYSPTRRSASAAS